MHDALFASLADAYGGRGVAVVLTGTGSDGAAGTAIVLKAGGVTLAQSRQADQWPGFSCSPVRDEAGLVIASLCLALALGRG